VLKYLWGTPDLALTLEGNDTWIVKWWVDALFAVHTNMKSHTGGTVSLGKGSIYSASTHQKLNTKSSTKAELVGVEDVMPLILWTWYFLDAQGYGVTENTVFQDNQSAILLEKDGRQSSSHCTHHINIRYFFVTDRIQSKELTVEYCPMGEILADMFTKPLQGTLFRCFHEGTGLGLGQLPVEHRHGGWHRRQARRPRCCCVSQFVEHRPLRNTLPLQGEDQL
jgi:hypothetical protein